MVDNPLRVLPFGEPAPDDTDATCVSLRNLQHKLLALPLGVGASLGYVGVCYLAPAKVLRKPRNSPQHILWRSGLVSVWAVVTSLLVWWLGIDVAGTGVRVVVGCSCVRAGGGTAVKS